MDEVMALKCPRIAEEESEPRPEGDVDESWDGFESLESRRFMVVGMAGFRRTGGGYMKRRGGSRVCDKKGLWRNRRTGRCGMTRINFIYLNLWSEKCDHPLQSRVS